VDLNNIFNKIEQLMSLRGGNGSMPSLILYAAKQERLCLH